MTTIIRNRVALMLLPLSGVMSTHGMAGELTLLTEVFSEVKGELIEMSIEDERTIPSDGVGTAPGSVVNTLHASRKIKGVL